MVVPHKKLQKARPNVSADAPLTALSPWHPPPTQFPIMHRPALVKPTALWSS